jgi:hypothetical protein
LTIAFACMLARLSQGTVTHSRLVARRADCLRLQAQWSKLPLDRDVCCTFSQYNAADMLSAESHDCTCGIELACYARLADLPCIRPSVDNSYRDGSRKPSVRCAARLTDTGCIHLHSSIRKRCRRNGRATGLDNLARDTGSPNEWLDKGRRGRA